jgi:hypothetical protein
MYFSLNHPLSRMLYDYLPIHFASKSGNDTKSWKVDHFEEITERNSSTDFGQQIQIGSADFVEKSKNERSANIGSH